MYASTTTDPDLVLAASIHVYLHTNDRSFIGTYAVILKGVTLGDQCVVAAGAVVRHSFPSRTIIAGNPAKRIGEVTVDGDEVQLHYDKR